MELPDLPTGGAGGGWDMCSNEVDRTKAIAYKDQDDCPQAAVKIIKVDPAMSEVMIYLQFAVLVRTDQM